MGLALIFYPWKGSSSHLDPSLGIADPQAAQTLVMRQQKDHPVTPEMSKAAASLGASAAPDFRLTSLEGEEETLQGLSQSRPLLIFFIEKQCPCCLGAKKFVDELATAYQGHLNVVGIINADQKVAEGWKLATRPKFQILLDPKMTAIQAYKAERGVYTTLIAPGGKVDKAYPGYSREMLQDASQRIAKLAGIPARPVEVKDAPDTMTSGCPFPDLEETSK